MGLRFLFHYDSTSNDYLLGCRYVLVSNVKTSGAARVVLPDKVLMVLFFILLVILSLIISSMFLAALRQRNTLGKQKFSIWLRRDSCEIGVLLLYQHLKFAYLYPEHYRRSDG